MKPIPGVTETKGKVTINTEIESTRLAVRLATYLYQWAQGESDLRKKERIVARKTGRPLGSRNGE